VFELEPKKKTAAFVVQDEGSSVRSVREASRPGGRDVRRNLGGFYGGRIPFANRSEIWE